MITKIIKNILVVCSVCCGIAAALTACSDDDYNHRPGLWTAQDIIKTFPGDTVLLQGQVSNYIGMRSVEISCEAWGIKQVYELHGKQSKVFDYNYRMAVPADATFDAELKITVTDKEGSENKKTIAMTYLPDTEAPVCLNDMPWQVSVDYDATAGYGTYDMNLSLTDDRGLKSVHVVAEDLNLDETIDVTGRSAQVVERYQIPQAGTFPLTVTIADEAGNEQTYWQQLVVMLAEDEDPISDYPIMWMVNAAENASDYLDGYYMPLTRQGAYQYQGSFYADKDGYQLYIVPTKTMSADIFGCSPYVSSKLMNKAGYVVPVTIEKAGYYGLWIDINAKTWSVWSLDTSAAYTGSLTFSGCGFNDFADWGWTEAEMTRNGYRYTQTLSQNGSYSGTRQYYAARISDWGWIMRFWSDANGCGWWADDAGYGGSVGTYESNYDGNVEVTFDTAIMWATVKK